MKNTVLTGNEQKAFDALAKTLDSYVHGEGEKWAYDMKAIACLHGETLRRTIERLVHKIEVNKAA